MSALTPITCKLKDPNAILKAKPRWMSKKNLEELKKKINLMLKKQMIRPTSNPFYASNVF